MTGSPKLWGVGLACALSGAWAGMAVGSTPMLDRSTLTAFYEEHAQTASRAESGRMLPNHYPLVTREGVVPVEKLSDRGLFAQARYRTMYGYSAPAEMEYAAYEPDAYSPEAYDPDAYDARWAAREQAPAVAGQAPAQGMAQGEAVPPLALADGPASPGQARTLDVQATLAMR